MAKEEQSLQDRIRARQQAGFVGRRDCVDLYQENLRLPLDDERRRFLFNIHGDAGAGKTYLTKHIQQLAIGSGALTAYVDETAGDITSVMRLISDGFRHCGTRLSEFDKRFGEYLKYRRELEGDPQTPAGIATLITKTAVTIGLAAARDIPVAGSVLAPLDPAATADQVDNARAYLARRFTDHGDVKLLLSPAAELTPPFVAGLNRAARGRDIALFFDTYEQTGPHLDQWLRDLYAGRYGDLPETLVTTISGQSPLDANLWADYLAVMADIPLGSFTEIDARQFLASKGITEEAAIQLIFSLSGRLPLWIATLASAYLRDGKDLGDPSGSAVERFLKWITDPRRREVAMTAAMPRFLNREVLAAITDPDVSTELFEWLRNVPFVSQRIASWAYHDVVRTAMLRLRRVEAPARWRSDHSTLAAAHANWARKAARGKSSGWTSREWVDCTREQCYHLLCADPADNLPTVLPLAVDAATHGAAHAYQWARLIDDAGRDTESIELRELAEKLEAGVKDDDVTDYLTCLISSGKLSKTALVVALTQRGRLRDTSSRSDALADFNQALRMSPDDLVALIWRSRAYDLLGRYDEALADLDRAKDKSPYNVHLYILRSYVLLDAHSWDEAVQELTNALELGEASAEVFSHRGEAYYGMGRYRDAIQDFTAALAINPDSARTLALRSDAYQATGRHRDAIDDLCKVVKLAPRTCMAFIRRGDAYKAMGSYDASIADYTSALGVDPNCVRALTLRADAYCSVARYDDAIIDCTRTIEIEPTNPGHFVGRGYMHESSGRYGEAIADYTSAIVLAPETEPRLGVIIAARGMMYASIGRYDDAIADFDRAAEIDPGNEEVTRARDNVRKSMSSLPTTRSNAAQSDEPSDAITSNETS